MAVGIELQVRNIRVYNLHRTKYTHKAKPFTEEILPKNTWLIDNPEWGLMIDGREFEFVVKHVEEGPGGRAELMKRINKVIEVADSIQKTITAHDAKRIRQIPKKAFGKVFKKVKIDFWVDTHAQGTMKAFPQANVGIRLARIRKLFRILSDKGHPQAQVYMRDIVNSASILKRYKDAASWNLRDPSWPANKPGARLRGLISLVVSYILSGIPENDLPIQAAKYRFPVMSRTQFDVLFEGIRQEEADYYMNNPDAWVRFICDTIMTQVLGNPLDPKGKLFGLKIDDRGKRDATNLISINMTREQWLKTIVSQHYRDPFTGRRHVGQWVSVPGGIDPEMGHPLRGLGELRNMDQIPYQGRMEPAVVFEFRGESQWQGMTSDSWADYTGQVYDFVSAVNTGDRHQAVRLP